MIVKFDSLNRYETPLITMCNPGSVFENDTCSKAIGILTDTSAEELVANFNAKSEFNFRVTQIQYENEDDFEHTQFLFHSLQNRRLLFVEDIGYFIITNMQNGCDENGVNYKDISAVSCEAEIENKILPFIENGTYKFTDLLEKIVKTLPLWTIGEIDPNISKRYRTFEDIGDDTNCLAFMLENMQDAYECIFVFDIIHRTIDVYDQDNYVRRTNIHLTKQDLIESIDITENSSDLYTALSVFGDEDLHISPVNPLGTTVIYNFNHYLNWMTDSLRSKVESWQNDINSYKDNYYDLNLRYYTVLDECSNLDNELLRLNTQLKMYQRCRDNIVAESDLLLVENYNSVITENGGTAISIADSIEETIAQIDGLISECNISITETTNLLSEKNLSLDTIKNQINVIQKAISFDTYFTDDEFEELCNFIYEGKYRDEYITVTDTMTYTEKFEQMNSLYNRAVKQLEKVSSPTQEYNVDVKNFIFDSNFASWSEQLETGCLINVELKENEIAFLFLSNITVNYDDGEMSMTFGNRFNKFDPKSLFDNVLGNIDKSANSINFIKDILYPIKAGEFSRMQELLQTSRNLTMNSALTSENEEVVIDGSGYTGRKKLPDGSFDPRQVKLTGKSIVFTNDAWDTCSVALGELIIGNDHTEYGLNADVIMGKMLVGTNLTIEAKNSSNIVTTRIDGDGLTINNGNIKIIDQTNGEVFGTDSNGNLYLAGTIYAVDGVFGGELQAHRGYIAGWEITDEYIQKTSLDNSGIPGVFLHSPTNWSLGDTSTDSDVLVVRNIRITDAGGNSTQDYPFVLKADGTLNCSKINASGGNIAGWQINSQMLSKSSGDYYFYLQSNPYTAGNDTPYNPVIAVRYQNDYKFFVRSNGYLYAKDAYIEGTIYADDGRFGGELQAYRGYIAGWEIHDSWFGKSNVTNYGAGLYAEAAGTESVCLAIGWMPNGLSGTWDYANFRVTGNGNLYAENAEIHGDVYANNGVFNGVINATDGTFSGTVQAGSIIGGEGGFSLETEEDETYYNLYGIHHYSTRFRTANISFDGSNYSGYFSLSPTGIYLQRNKGSGNSSITITDVIRLSSISGAGVYIGANGNLTGTWKLNSSETVISDYNLKHDIEALSDSYSVFFDALQPKRFKYNDGTSDRYHIGFIAQEVYEAFTNAGLDSQEVGAYVHFEKSATNEEHLGLRYDEFIALNTMQIQKLKSRIIELEKKVYELEIKLNSIE